MASLDQLNSDAEYMAAFKVKWRKQRLADLHKIGPQERDEPTLAEVNAQELASFDSSEADWINGGCK